MNAPPADRSVFINCPFDGSYGPALDAIIFTVQSCGYIPRSALETDNVADSRMKRIVDALQGSHLSIHDLSRVYGDAESGVAHFNMPLELGIAIATSLAPANAAGARAHDWMALVLSGSAYRAAISDLNGYDLKRYEPGTEGRESLVVTVMHWLVQRPTCPQPDREPSQIWEALDAFDAQLVDLRQRWRNNPPWRRVLETADQVLAAHGLGPRPAGAAAGAPP